MATDQKRAALEKMKTGWAPYSYKPVRRNIHDIMNASPSPLLAGPRPPFTAIAQNIRQTCSTKEGELPANLSVAEGAYNLAVKHNLNGLSHEILPLQLGIGVRATYWSQMILNLDGLPVVPFFDPRRTKELNAKARQFVFSAMHQHIRMSDPNLSSVGLLIIQFAKNTSGPREAVLHLDHGVELLSYEALDAMVKETYEIWQDVYSGRLRDIRRSSGHGGTLL
jgi:hypothetical protein